MDERQEILSFATEYAKDFPWAHSPLHVFNWAQKDPDAWNATKRFILARNAPPASADSPKARDQHQAHISQETQRVAETVRTMKSMFQAGATIEEINERVPCWVDESGWSEESIGIIVGTNPPMNWSFLKRMGEMKVLVACEFSGIVRDAFIERGHDAISCDLLPTERPGPAYPGRRAGAATGAVGLGNCPSALPEVPEQGYRCTKG